MQNAFHDRMTWALLWRYPRIRGNTYRTFSVRPFCRQVDDVILRVSLLRGCVLDSIPLLFIMSMEEEMIMLRTGRAASAYPGTEGAD